MTQPATSTGRKATVRLGFALAVVLATAILALRPGSAWAQFSGFSTFYAKINANGYVAKGNGIQSARPFDTGQYIVTFNRPVNTCVFVTSLTMASPGYSTANASANNSSAILVYTFSKTGAAQGLPFSIIVMCGP